MTKQTVSFTMKKEPNGDTTIEVKFDPVLVTNEEQFSKLSNDSQILQSAAMNIASQIVKASS